MPLRTLAVVTFGTLAGVPPLAAKLPPSCAVVGDSIALGVSQQMPGCRRNAKIGIPSDDVIDRIDGAAEINIVSAGSNDPHNPRLHDNLKRIRSQAKRVVWILPVEATARAAVAQVAAAHGDPAVAFEVSDDRVHPRSYADLAQAVSQALED